ncbi:galactitol-1-phosphate 5-dehydrogenase [Cohnella ginsengisoli]|uniref:Galactitol-1-phosphate 5-dehydrogenase n=1 Tax=Cohnella ginsengisoli TaxID=425004 RepID=A0A9X4KL10_9BACL|nr:galactitol-1-phosphate 5-dehydrogenase [Cohnella ginsengisoli]MDG0794172.1 galactitol-1-phosphate 5-dehydrogenase [Cohnella ginsengisoli]
MSPRVFRKGTYTFPTIPGHEFAGRIVELGEGADPALLGRKAAVFPLIPCFRCPSCEVGEYAQCENYDYMGSRRDGAFAEYICVPVWNVLPAPDHLSYEELAMTEPAAVAVHALRQATVDIGDQVFISGAGPIGMMLAAWAKAWGASRVLLSDIDPDKLAFANALGFADTVNAREEDAAAWVRRVTRRGADVCVEGAGNAVSWETCLNAARTSGRVVLMGNPEGEMKLTQNGYWDILRKQLTLKGTWNSAYADLPKNEWRLVLDSMASGQIDLKPLTTHRVTLDGLQGAMAMMRDRSAFYNKVMVVNPTEEDEA